MPSDRSLFAVIPAAGHSRRMGRPKLLLPLGESTVLERLIRAVSVPELSQIVIVVRRDDIALQAAILALQHSEPRLQMVLPETDPPDMKASILAAVTFIEATWAPGQQAAWLLVPADFSLLDRETTARLVARWKEIAPDANRTPSPSQTERESASILIPTCNGRRGHPILLGWHWAAGVAALSEDQGLNALIREAGTAVAEFPCDDAGVLVDLDTPGDYEQARKQIEQMRTQVPG